MNVDATYTIEIDGHKLALTHTQAKELHRKLGVFLGDGPSESNRNANRENLKPWYDYDGPWKQTPIMCGSKIAKPVMAPVGILIPPQDSGAAIEFSPAGIAGSASLCNKFAGSSHTATTLQDFEPHFGNSITTENQLTGYVKLGHTTT